MASTLQVEAGFPGRNRERTGSAAFSWWDARDGRVQQGLPCRENMIPLDRPDVLEETGPHPECPADSLPLGLEQVACSMAKAKRFGTTSTLACIGHGFHNLSSLFACLAMPAFLIDQVLEHCCGMSRKTFRKHERKLYLWNAMGRLFTSFTINR